MLGQKPMAQWVEEYGHSHQHPVNRLCHTFGIPMIVVSILLAAGLGIVALTGLAGPLAGTGWWVAGGLFVVGWVLQFIGHAFEGKPPEFFRDWRFLFVGLRWWMTKVVGGK
jgi:uncharacterized membrane protein YGL010W